MFVYNVIFHLEYFQSIGIRYSIFQVHIAHQRCGKLLNILISVHYLFVFFSLQFFISISIVHFIIKGRNLIFCCCFFVFFCLFLLSWFPYEFIQYILNYCFVCNLSSRIHEYNIVNLCSIGGSWYENRQIHM